MDKKGQWVRTHMRELRSRERNDRVFQTYILKKSKHSTETIARELGVSPNTVAGYLREIKDNPSYYEGLLKDKEERERKVEQERLRKLNRTDKKIYEEEIKKGILWGALFCFIALLWWWFPSLIIYVGGGVMFGRAYDLVPWIYSVKGFIISTLVVSTVISFFRIQSALIDKKEFGKKRG